MAEDDGVGASGGKVVEGEAREPAGQRNEMGRGERRERRERREIKEEGEEELERNVGRDVVPESYGMLREKR